MATLEQIVANGTLEPFSLPDREDRCAIRELYVATILDDWLYATEELYTTKIGPMTIMEHLEQAFCDFRCSPAIHHGDIRRLMPTNEGIWKMHPPGLRIYGWCPKIGTFVAVCGAKVADTKADAALNDEKLGIVLNFIRDNRLQHTVLGGDFLALFPKEN